MPRSPGAGFSSSVDPDASSGGSLLVRACSHLRLPLVIAYDPGLSRGVSLIGSSVARTGPGRGVAAHAIRPAGPRAVAPRHNPARTVGRGTERLTPSRIRAAPDADRAPRRPARHVDTPTVVDG